MTTRLNPQGVRTFVVFRNHRNGLRNYLIDNTGGALYVGAASEYEVEVVLNLWVADLCVENYHAAITHDVLLPGGAMALLAAAIDQWGLPRATTHPLPTR